MLLLTLIAPVWEQRGITSRIDGGNETHNHKILETPLPHHRYGRLLRGIYHRISSGKISWFGIAQENSLRAIVAGVLEQALRLKPSSKLDSSKLEQNSVAYLAGLAKRAEKYQLNNDC